MPPTPAGSAPGLLRRAWRAVAAVAGVVRAELRGGRVSAAGGRRRPPGGARPPLRLLWAGVAAGGARLAVHRPAMWRHRLRLKLVYPGTRRPGWPGGARISLTPDALCRYASMNPAVWSGGARLPTAAEWQERYTPSRRRLHADLARNDRRRPLAALRRRWRRLALRPVAIATPPAAARPTPATPRGWPPALASPLRG